MDNKNKPSSINYVADDSSKKESLKAVSVDKKYPKAKYVSQMTASIQKRVERNSVKGPVEEEIPDDFDYDDMLW